MNLQTLLAQRPAHTGTSQYFSDHRLEKELQTERLVNTQGSITTNPEAEFWEQLKIK